MACTLDPPASRADPDNLDAGIAFTRDEVMPAIQQIDGCIALSMLTDREHGRCIVTTSWADADAMRAANEDVHPIRLMHALGAQGSDIQEWEIAVLHRERPAGDGAGAQVTWARIPPDHLNELLDAYRHNLMPRLQELTGFDSLSMLVDRPRGQRRRLRDPRRPRWSASRPGTCASSSPRPWAPASQTSRRWTLPSPTCGSRKRSDGRRYARRSASSVGTWRPIPAARTSSAPSERTPAVP